MNKMSFLKIISDNIYADLHLFWNVITSVKKSLTAILTVCEIVEKQWHIMFSLYEDSHAEVYPGICKWEGVKKTLETFMGCFTACMNHQYGINDFQTHSVSQFPFYWVQQTKILSTCASHRQLQQPSNTCLTTCSVECRHVLWSQEAIFSISCRNNCIAVSTTAVALHYFSLHRYFSDTLYIFH